MYIIKNALRCISRAKGRNVLIGVIVLVIALSACIGLSIRQAALNAREETLSQMSVTANISFDRRGAMENMKPPSPSDGERPDFDKDGFAEMMGDSSSLTLEEYETYAEADSVKDFYYSMTVDFNGSEDLEPVSSQTQEESSSQNSGGGFGGMPQFGGFGGMGSSSDFQIIGYSSDAAMTDFADGIAKVESGEVFAEGTTAKECIITAELATYNSLGVGDTIIVTNPDNEEEEYKLKIVGVYTTEESNEEGFSMMGRGMTSGDPANRIYMSYAALEKMLDASEKANEESEDTSALSGDLSATYSFADVESYEKFEEQVREMGLDEEYTVSSQDITAFEASLTPLNTLSTMAGWFLLVILIIGAIILIVLNIFNVRERKYEIGVLTAMGMKKGKVALQFMTEIFVVTIIAVIIGALVGGICAVPVTNVLLEAQTTSQSSRADQLTQGFGRENGAMPPMGGGFGGSGGGAPEMPGGGGFAEMFGGAAADYITEIDSAMNLTVVLQMLGIAVLLTLVAGAVAILFVMRYEPLKILANRD